MKRTITSQVYRRRLDRTQPSLRSNEWVPTVTHVERRIPDECLAEFERLCSRLGRPGVIQHNVGGSFTPAALSTTLSGTMTGSGDHNHVVITPGTCTVTSGDTQ